MKEHLKNLTKLLLTLCLLSVLQSCGGSGNKTPKYSISASISNVVFSNEFLHSSDDTIALTVNYNGNGLLVGFAPDAQPAAWLNYRTGDITSNTATIYIDVVNAEFLAADKYNTTLRLSTGDPAGPDLVNVDIDVSLLVWQLSTDHADLSFADTFGVSSIASQTLQITSENNDWQAAVDVDWLTLDQTSGSGSATLTLTPNLASLTQAGLYQANLTLTETSTGDSKVVPIELALDNRYLYADRANIAFTNTNNNQTLNTTVRINSNSPTAVSWNASTSADWLTVTRIADSDQLNIIADPNLAPSNALTQADIVVSAGAESPVLAETIHVSLYNDELTSDTQTISGLTLNSNAMVLAPLAPRLYVAVNNELRVYQQYSGELLDSMAIAPAGSLLEQLVIHPDGHVLLAQADETITDEQGGESTVTHRYQIDLSTMVATELTEASIQYDPVRFVRIAGRYFVVTRALEFADENLNRLAWDTQNAFYARSIDFAGQTGALYALDGSNESIKRFTATVNDFATQQLSPQLTHEYHPESLADGEQIRDMVVNNDETQLYLISPSSEWLSFDGTSYTDNGLLESNADIVTLALTKSADGRAHFARFDPMQGFIVNVYDEQQTLSNTLNLGSNQPSSIALSADQQRLLSYSANNQALTLLNLSGL